MATVEDVLQTIGQELDIAPDRLVPSARIDGLDVESMDMVAAGLALEQRFGVSLEQRDLLGLETLGALAEKVLAKQQS